MPLPAVELDDRLVVLPERVDLVSEEAYVLAG